MINYIFNKIFGTYSEKKIKAYRSYISEINALENDFKDFTENDCHQKTAELKQRLKNGSTLDSLIPEAFALVRHAAFQTLGERHFDVQLLGGLALNDNQIAEMKTGEGKTLTSTLPIYLNALTGKGVHVITVNDYLAKRDSEWMGIVYSYLGLTVGLIQHDLEDEERREAYAADITYGTNNEFGFDYLRDNMKFDIQDYVQREHAYAIIDEVDSILIDEARTPLIISGASEDSTDKYQKIDKIMFGLKRAWRISDNPDEKIIAEAQKIELHNIKSFLREKEQTEIVIPGDYTLEEQSKNIHLTEEGIVKIEQRIPQKMLRSNNLYDLENMEILHHVNQALKAHYIFKRDIDYVVQNGQVLIVDEFTGRLMEGRRFSDGLHQALEAKEKVKIEKENQTLASITFQNYFRKYEKLSGMTGTAETEAEEFMKIYGLGVVVIPTNMPMIRKDKSDVIYKTLAAKNRAIVKEIQRLHQKKQPVLVGTASIESSEILSKLLKQSKIPHNVLNAKYHEKEAEIIAQAGEIATITIATNMAGRGTDIKITDEIREKGGLYILGTERHESRRIDNQLRGRSGRQGDIGESRFFLSLEDDLLRIFGGERISRLMDRLKIDEDEAIEHILISKAIENSQKKVEAYHFEIRKHLLEYDDVMNRQREIIYKQRRQILTSEVSNVLQDMMDDQIDKLLDEYCNERFVDQWDLEGLHNELHTIFNLSLTLPEEDAIKNQDHIADIIHQEIKILYQQKKEEFADLNEDVQRHILLEYTDSAWKDHLLSMDYLKEAIGLSGYAQKNPLDEYKKEAYYMFASLIEKISHECVITYFNAQVNHESTIQQERRQQEMQMIHGELEAPKVENKTVQRKIKKIGRNDPCPCGSGKKYKNCHLHEDEQQNGN